MLNKVREQIEMLMDLQPLNDLQRRNLEEGLWTLVQLAMAAGIEVNSQVPR